MAEENNTDKIRQEYKTIAEETAAIFGNTLGSIAADFSRKLREESSTLDDLSKSLLRNFKNDLTSLSRSASSLIDIQSRMVSGSLKQQDISRAQFQLDQKLNKLFLDRDILRKEGIELSEKEEAKLKDAVKAVEEQKKEYENLLKIDKEINKELGTTGAILKGVDKLFNTIGISNPFGEVVSNVKAARSQIKLNERELFKIYNSGVALNDTDKERVKDLETQNGDLLKQTKIGAQLGSAFKEAFDPVNLAIGLTFALIGKVIQSFGKLNKAQTDIRRNLGQSVESLNLIDTKFGTQVNQLETINSLTEQFGFNTTAAFDAINLREATELTVAMGLSAEEAGMLAFNAQVSGQNLSLAVDQAIKGVSPLLSQRKVLQEITKLAPSITLAFKNNNVELAKAASNAKLLGLNLTQVDKVAEGLLDIEQSLTAEFEAEVITGKQLNLERARFFALTNQTAELTKEIGKNQEIINSFSNGTRIEQDAIAGALGLSRDELSKMVQEQKVLSTMSAEDIKAKEEADFKRQTAQQTLNDSIAKMAEALAGPAELMADFLVSIKSVLPIITGIVLATKAYALATSAVVAVQSVLNRKKTQQLATEGAIAMVGALANPARAIAGVAAASFVAGLVGGYMLKGNDIMSEGGYGKRTLLGPEGAIALNNKDTVIAGTNLFPQPEKGIDKQFSTPTPQESKPLEIRGLDKLLSTFSIQPSKQLELNQASSLIQPLGREIEPSLPTTTPFPERGIERNSPTSTTVAIDYDKLANAIAMGAERGTAKAKLNVNLDGNRISNELQTPMAMNTRGYSV